MSPKLWLEDRIGTYVPVTHTLLPWFFEHTCTLLNALSKGLDGRTPWERSKGRPMRQLLLGFARASYASCLLKGPETTLTATWAPGGLTARFSE